MTGNREMISSVRMQSNRRGRGGGRERERERYMDTLVSEVRQMGHISKPDTHTGLRNSLAFSRPSPEYLFAFSSPQNISHLMSLRPRSRLPQHFPSLFCFSLFIRSTSSAAVSPSLSLSVFLYCHSLYPSATHSNSNLHFALRVV